MIRFAWLQARTQSLLAATALAAVAITAAITGLRLQHTYAATVAPCHAHGDCSHAIASFLSHDHGLGDALTNLNLFAPALIGIFWGAPLLARELETGSFRLAWTQSITRSRWLAVRLGLVGLAGVTAAGLLSLTITWWFRSTDRVNANRLDPSQFGERGIVTLGYAAFAFALGVFAGAIIRRTVPAMALTLGAFAATRYAATFWLRPHLFSPLHTNLPVSAASDMGFTATGSGPLTFVASHPAIANAWVHSSKIVDASGTHASNAVLSQFLQQRCPDIANPRSHGGAGGSPTAFQDCVNQISAKFHLVATYQPASRYWPLQWSETAIFLALAALATAATFWWIRHRVG